MLIVNILYFNEYCNQLFFTSLETFSYTSIFKTFVLTFYFNKYGLW